MWPWLKFFTQALLLGLIIGVGLGVSVLLFLAAMHQFPCEMDVELSQSRQVPSQVTLLPDPAPQGDKSHTNVGVSPCIPAHPELYA